MKSNIKIKRTDEDNLKANTKIMGMDKYNLKANIKIKRGGWIKTLEIQQQN